MLFLQKKKKEEKEVHALSELLFISFCSVIARKIYQIRRIVSFLEAKLTIKMEIHEFLYQILKITIKLCIGIFN